MPTLKTCDRCGQAKPASETFFPYNGRNRDRLATYCRACSPAVAAERRRRKTERSREWAAANREKVRESNRKSYARTRRERLAYYRRWRQLNKARTDHADGV